MDHERRQYDRFLLSNENEDMRAISTKAATVKTPRITASRKLYAMESPQNWFEDFGSPQLVDGLAVAVAIEPVFAQTVNLDETYRVLPDPARRLPALRGGENYAGLYRKSYGRAGMQHSLRLPDCC